MHYITNNVNISPQALGNKNQNNISMRMRGIHPSYLGKIDISVVGSDPGVNSIITPFCETNGLYFNENNEPENFKYVFENDVFKYRKDTEPGVFIDYTQDDDFIKLKEYSDSLIEKCSVIERESESNKYEYVKYIMPDELDPEEL